MKAAKSVGREAHRAMRVREGEKRGETEAVGPQWEGGDYTVLYVLVHRHTQRRKE